ncbi:MAG: PEP-CTERM sorting domain-containing protein [Chloroflexota bacterium]|nr:PEP-CTERM sorting domain-containing protein [Chloroflexota bacterium]
MRTRRLTAALLFVPLLVASVAAHPSLVAAAGCDSGDSSLANGGFEVPGVAANDVSLMDSSLVPPGTTTDSANQIEVWGDGFLGVPAYEGTSFAEINANSAGTLYQDVVTTPGSTLNWTLQHRGRDATDVMKVLIGDATVADVTSDTGWDAVSPDISDAETAWGEATGAYVVPTGQTCTRFAFRAVSSGVGNESYGNLIDAIGFTIQAPPPPPTPDPTGTAAPIATTRPQVTIPPTDTLAGPSAVRGEDSALAALLGSIAGLGLIALGLARKPGRRRP